MAVTEKVLKIRIEGDTSSAQTALNRVNTALQGTQVTASNVKTVLDTITNTFNHEIDVTASKLSSLRSASRSILGSFPQSADQTDPSSRITQNIQQEAAARRTASARIHRQEADEAITALNQRLQREQVARVHGATSIQAIELNAAQQELAIRRRLADEILSIEQRVREGLLRGQVVTQAARQAALNRASAQLTANRQSLEAAQALERQRAATEAASNAQQSFAARVVEGISIYRVFSFVLNNVTNAIKAIPKIGIELDSTKASLLATTGGAEQASAALNFLNREAERTGIRITDLRQTFRNFQASTSLAGESIQTAVKIFTNFNTAVTALHLSSDQTQSVFLALAQIFNKSKVQSEELVKQLGNLLPGAFAAFAKASNTTTQQLAIDMKNGIVFAHDTILAFSEFYANQFAPSFAIASQAFNAQVGRLSTSFTLLGESIYNLSSGTLVTIVKGLTSVIDYLRDATTGANNFGQAVKIGLEAALVAGTVALARLAGGFIAARTAALSAEAALVGMSTSALALKNAFLFLSSPTAIITGLGFIALHIANTTAATKELIKTLEEARDAEFRKQTGTPEENKLALEIDQDATVIAAKETLDKIDKLLEKTKVTDGKRNFLALAATGASEEELRTHRLTAELALQNAIDKVQQASLDKAGAESIQALEARAKTTFDIHQEYLKNIQTADAQAELANSQFLERFRGAKAEEEALVAKGRLSKAKGDARDATAEEIRIGQEASKALLELEQARLREVAAARDKFNDKANKTGTKVEGTLSKNLYKDLARDSANAAKVVKDSLRDLDEGYKDNLVSFSDYFQKKKALQLQSLTDQIASIDASRAQAESVNDIAKIAEFEDKRSDLVRQTQEVQREADREKSDALKEYNAKLLEIQVGALESSGREEEANAIQVKAKFLDLEKFAKINNNTLALQQLNISKQYELSKGVLNKLSREEGELSSTLQAKEARIHLNRQSGIITQRQAQVELNKLRQEYADNEDVIIEKLKQELALNEGNTEIANRILEATNKRNEVAFAGAGFNKQFTRGPNFVTEFEDTGGQIADSREQSLRQLREANLSNLQEVKDKELAIESEYVLASAKNYAGFYGGIAATGAETFLGLTEAAQKMYGEQSKQAKQAFLVYKATKVAEATAATAKAVIEAYGAGPYIGPVLAGIAAAFGAVQIATIVSQPLPQAHAGLTNAPQNQTFNISKGERVVAPQQNRDLTKALSEGSLSGKQSNQSQNIRIINAVDPALFSEYLGSEQGEKVVMNIVKRNNG